MLLEDLYTPQTKTINLKKPIGNVKIDYDKELGHGKFSSVKNSKDEHMVDKKSTTSTFDPYWMYIDKLIKDRMYEKNPYFPRIYSVKSYADPRGETLYKGTMEKLISHNDCSMEELVACYENIFGPSQSEFMEGNTFYIASKISGKLASAIELGNFRDKLQGIGDEQWVQAIKWLIDCYRSFTSYDYGIFIDLHANNIMFRRTKYGIQLVITDPFAI